MMVASVLHRLRRSDRAVGTNSWGPWGSASLAVLALAGVVGCGGGSGSGGPGNTGEDLSDPVIPLVGPTGKYSMTPDEANTALGLNPPPLLPPATQDGQNHWLRMEVPFVVDRSTVLADDPLLAPFSFLKGNVTITDSGGKHVRCTVLINGIDRTGRDRSGEEGYPAI